MAAFSDPSVISQYEDATARLVPGYKDLQQMTLALLEESIPTHKANILVVGAGGGMELKLFADAQQEWTFEGVDPSEEMLQMARLRLQTDAHRVTLHHGYIYTASDEAFDGATCLLTMHFLDAEERLRTLTEIHRRLKPGAPLILAHHSFPNDKEGKRTWLSRYAAFAVISGVSKNNAYSAAEAISQRLPILSPQEEEALFKQAGFKNITAFYHAFSFRGWVGYC